MPRLNKNKQTLTEQMHKAKRSLQWPKIKTKPLNSLEVTQLHGPAMLQVDNVLTSQEAGRFVDAVEQSGLLTHQSSRGAKYGEAFRDNDRFSVDDPVLADQLWQATGLRQLMGSMSVDGMQAVGLNPNIRVYRYSAGQRFGKHVDDSIDLPNGRITKYTLLIYLSGGTGSAVPLKGGETMFYGARGRLLASVCPTAGRALLHLHGDDCLEHEGAVVKKGRKYVLRSDVVFA